MLIHSQKLFEPFCVCVVLKGYTPSSPPYPFTDQGIVPRPTLRRDFLGCQREGDRERERGTHLEYYQSKLARVSDFLEGT